MLPMRPSACTARHPFRCLSEGVICRIRHGVMMYLVMPSGALPRLLLVALVVQAVPVQLLVVLVVMMLWAWVVACRLSHRPVLPLHPLPPLPKVHS